MNDTHCLTQVSGAGVFIVFFSVASIGHADTFKVDCNKGQNLQTEVSKAKDGDFVEVAGVCSENVVIEKNRITMSAVGGATLNGPDADQPTIRVRGLNVTVENFASISGGSNVVLIHRAGSATFQGNTIENGSSSGALVNNSGFVRLAGDTIRNNTNHGVVVRQAASADIFSNNITGNGIRGIQVSDGASADIDKNAITSNGSDGIRVRRTSHVRVSEDSDFGQPNLIELNGGRGVRCQINSSVTSGVPQNLGAGNNLGNTFFDSTCVPEGAL